MVSDLLGFMPTRLAERCFILATTACMFECGEPSWSFQFSFSHEKNVALTVEGSTKP